MLKRYLTVKDFGFNTIIIKKSEFITYVKNIDSELGATQFIETIKKKHWNATHNCSAYVIGERDEIQKASDDGEPSGTAGKPILEIIKKLELKDTSVVVTRYFGGIMLGAGGLIRAYGTAAKEGILTTGIIERILYRKIIVSVDYPWYGKIENEMNSRGYTIYETIFMDKVTVTILELDGEEENFIRLIMNITNGQVDLITGENIYVDRDVKL
ncbi:MAG: YigZ family protein [Vulcanibacillus sp.]